MITVVLIKVITVIIFTQIKKTVFAFNFKNNQNKLLGPSLVKKSVNISWFSCFSILSIKELSNFHYIFYKALQIMEKVFQVQYIEFMAIFW